MLVELAVRNLGVIAESRIPVGPGLTAVTGETGAGKTMVVEALGLLSGDRADPSRVRAGSAEAVVEGLFVGAAASEHAPDADATDPADRTEVGAGEDLEREWVLRRVVPASGRSRAYVDGNLATVATLAGIGRRSIEIHGQHAQQAILQSVHQRDALDRHAGIDTRPLQAARRTVERLERRLDGLGGDDRARAREIDLLRYQIDEIEAAEPRPGEEELLDAEEDLLADALAHREAAARALEVLGGEGGVLDELALALEALRGRSPFEAPLERLRAVEPELRDVLGDLRGIGDGIEPDDERLKWIRDRRHRLVELRRKYGDDIAAVLEHLDATRLRLDELASVDAARSAVVEELAAARTALSAEARAVGQARRAAAPLLADALVQVLAELAMPGCHVEVAVEDRPGAPDAGDAVEIRLAANPGLPPRGLGQVASGGELSRVMLALRLVLSGGPDVMVFDEVDAGIGGEVATAVGDALARLSAERQVIVVTHLPQVAAFADHHLLVSKHSDDSHTVTVVDPLDDDARVVELSRMMTGRPDSTTARDHAGELLAATADRRGRR